MKNLDLELCPRRPAGPPLILGGLSLLAVLLLTSCAQRSAPPRFEAEAIAGYTNLKREFGPLDFTPLQGRKVVLDPGHGGYFRGAVGPAGLTEAEVNLGVALYLRGLLEWAGAEVWLTRTADHDFLSPADSTLSGDLAFRVNFTNNLQPDAFISIHHNSTASADPEINETQTYYPLGREDTCLDLARSIHRHLVLNLGITPAKILPGNFHVLRGVRATAVLGEPAMISNPVIEGRLTLAASHELEARAYFLGLLDFFAGGSPRWAGSTPDTTLSQPGLAAAPVTWSFDPGAHPGDPGPDPGTFRLTRDGLAEPFVLSPDGYRVTWTPGGPLPEAPVVLELVGSNLAGRATPVSRKVLLPSPQPTWQLTVRRERPEDRAEPHDLIRWWSGWPAEANQGWPGSPTSGPPGGFALVPRLAEVRTGAEALLREVLGWAPPLRDWREDEPIARDRWAHLLTLAGEPAWFAVATPPGGWQDRLATPGARAPLDAGRPYLLATPETPVWVEARGVQPLIDPAPTTADTARTVAGSAPYWQAEKLVPALYGAVVVLDPRGGGTDTDGVGPLGTRGADVNLAVALRARQLLEGAGATVLLTRTAEHAPPPQDKVRLAGQAGADLFLTIGRGPRAGAVTVAHHPGSPTGSLWAAAMAEAALPLRPAGASLTTEVGPSYAYLLRHTACPALEVGFPPLTSPEREAQAASGAWQLAEARAVLLAAAAALGQTDLPARTLNLAAALSRLPRDRALPRVQWARLDGNFHWLPTTAAPPLVATPGDSLSCDQTAADGPGYPDLVSRHTLEIHQGALWQVWLLDRSDGSQEPRLLLEGR